MKKAWVLEAEQQEMRAKYARPSADEIRHALRLCKGYRDAAKYFGVCEITLRKRAREFGIATNLRRTLGAQGEWKVVLWLRRCGFEAALSNHGDPYDCICANKRVEIKTATFSHGTWLFNVHRKTRMTEELVDIYVLRLINGPLFKSLHLVIPSPVRRKVISITPKTLLTRYRNYVERVDLIGPVRRLRRVA